MNDKIITTLDPKEKEGLMKDLIVLDENCKTLRMWAQTAWSPHVPSAICSMIGGKLTFRTSLALHSTFLCYIMCSFWGLQWDLNQKN